MPSSRLHRLTRLGAIAGQVARAAVYEGIAPLLSRQIDDEQSATWRETAAERVVEQLGQLRGAAMKVGQTLALASTALDLPAEVQGVLARMHHSAPPVPFATIVEDVEAALGHPLHMSFASFYPTPLGTASLGQAHAAVLLDGRPVVVKIRHRDIVSQLETDLWLMRGLFISGRLLRRSREELEATFEEIRARLMEEADYALELTHIADFYARYGALPGVVIPAPIPALCSSNMLTMTRVPGMPLGDFLALAPPEAVERAGHTVVRLYFSMIFSHRTLHADPHPGNFLFQLDGTVGLVDYGCVKRFSSGWMTSYAQTALATRDGDTPALLAALQRLGVWDGEDAGDAALLVELASLLATPFQADEFVIGGAPPSLLEVLRPALARLPTHPKIHLPPDFIFLHRALGGVYTLLREMVVRGPWGALLAEYAQTALTPETP